MKNLISLVLFLVVLFGSVGAGIVYRFSVIEASKNKKLNTFPDLYRELGKPIKVYQIKKGDLKLSARVTGIVKSRRILEVFVEKNVFDSLNEGGEFFGLNSYKHITGKVAKIYKKANVQTGLYKVQLTSKKLLPKKGTLFPMEIEVRNLQSRTIVPVRAIIPRKGKLTVWRIKGKEVESVQVKIGLYNNKFVEIKGGVKEGDRIVSEGTGLLESGDKFRIVKN